MYDQGKGKLPRDKVAGSSAPAQAERRGTNRHAITVVAEIVDIDSGARFATRTSDLGPGGCFVDSLTPFPIGSKVHVTVRHGDTDFKVGGAVVYSQVGLGMGIAFDEQTYEQRLDLEGWLVEVTSGKRDPQAKQPAPKSAQPPAEINQVTLVQLIKLLVTKRILTDSEAKSILQDPIL